MKDSIPFYKQYQDCSKIGENSKKEIVSWKLSDIPISPKVRYQSLHYNAKTEKGEMHFQKCGKFGGICNSDNKSCAKFRGEE